MIMKNVRYVSLVWLLKISLMNGMLLRMGTSTFIEARSMMSNAERNPLLGKNTDSRNGGIALIIIFSERPTIVAFALSLITNRPKTALRTRHQMNDEQIPAKMLPEMTVNTIEEKAPTLIPASSAKFIVPAFWTNTPPIQHRSRGVDIWTV